MTSKFVENVPLAHGQGNSIHYAAIRWPDFSERPPFGRSFGHFSRHPDTLPPAAFSSPSISSTYAGAGLRRNSSIRRRISRNRFRETATSAIWNVTQRPGWTFLAPILTSASRNVVTDQCSGSSGMAAFSFGSRLFPNSELEVKPSRQARRRQLDRRCRQ